VSFLLPCPNCGPRPVDEFSCTGEVTVRPQGSPDLGELTGYLYFRRNAAGVQKEWWCHRRGCEAWFTAERDTRTNEVLLTELPRAPAADGAPGAEATPSVGENPAV